MIHCDLDLFCDIHSVIDQHLSKTKSLPFIDSSKPFLYIYKRESKGSSIISSVSLPIKISMLLDLECIILYNL